MPLPFVFRNLAFHACFYVWAAGQKPLLESYLGNKVQEYGIIDNNIEKFVINGKTPKT